MYNVVSGIDFCSGLQNHNEQLQATTVAFDNGKGWKWLDENGVERLRFQRPQKGFTKWTREKNGYFRWMDEAGEHLDEAGKVVPKTDPDFLLKTHIPYNGL